MKVHHLNCATMHPAADRFMFGDAPAETRHFVCHCLLVEAEDGLVLVDSGFGTADVREKGARLGRLFCGIARPAFDESETALRQVERLGFRASDVRHIVLTHLDLDHAGGLADFPHAAVHVLAGEHAAATGGGLMERLRYRAVQWAHGPDWRCHEPDGERWFGFERVRAVPGVPPEVLLIPLLGHSRGHCGVAVDAGDGWLLHCGDAYFHRDEMVGEGSCPRGLSLFQRVVQADAAARLHNQARLRELAATGEVRLFSAHDPVELARLRAEAVSSAATPLAR